MKSRTNPLLTPDVAAAPRPLPARKNALLEEKPATLVDVEELKSPCRILSPASRHKRELRDQRRIDSAAAALEGFTRDVRIYGFTKGQFSLIQLITAALAHTGPADLVLSTWTAANADVSEVLAFCESGLVTSARWLVDLSFSKRSPQLAQRIRATFGDDAIRVAKNHAKYATLGNDQWQLVIHTSMNLNHNPRFENYEIAHDPELYGFHQKIVDEIWRRQARAVEGMRPYQIELHFRDEL